MSLKYHLLLSRGKLKLEEKLHRDQYCQNANIVNLVEECNMLWRAVVILFNFSVYLNTLFIGINVKYIIFLPCLALPIYPIYAMYHG